MHSEIRRQTINLPVSAGEGVPVSANVKRRVASFEGSSLDQKRPRTSKSPEVDHQGAMFTPRLSREPPSPFMSDNLGESRSQVAGPSTGNGSRRRGTTPYAYATPHSNTIATVDFAGGDGDTEADTEIIQNEDRDKAEEEWHGVAEDETRLQTDATTDLDNDDDSDEFDGDIEEGLTIYEE
jgi:hypothetical protein